MQQNEPLGITKVALDAMGGDNATGEIDGLITDEPGLVLATFYAAERWTL